MRTMRTTFTTKDLRRTTTLQSMNWMGGKTNLNGLFVPNPVSAEGLRDDEPWRRDAVASSRCVEGLGFEV